MNAPRHPRVFGVQLHSMGLSVREVATVLDVLSVDRSYGAVWNGRTISQNHRLTRRRQQSRIAVDEKQIEVDGEKKWLYAAIDTDSKLLLDIDVYSRRRICRRRDNVATHYGRPFWRQLSEEPLVQCLIRWNGSTNAKHCPRCAEYHLAKLNERPLPEVAAAESRRRHLQSLSGHFH